MKIKNKYWCLAVSVFFIMGLTGCSHSAQPEMVNELRYSVGDISDLTISYDEENITFYMSDSDEIVIREYMTEKDKAYYAKVSEDGNSVHISEGRKPFFKDGFLRYVEVELPSSYQKGLTVTTTDGNIDFSETKLILTSLRIDSTAGNVNLKDMTAKNMYLSSTSGMLDLYKLQAEAIHFMTTSGKVSCDTLNGSVICTTTSGDVSIKNAVGSGEYKNNNSGLLEIDYSEVTGDLLLFNKNGDIRLTIPDDLEFDFTAETKNGTIRTSFQDEIKTNGAKAEGKIGKNPVITIETETRNGKIEVNK
ncbi:MULTISPECIES: DUF4097 family beta strand repeat-containing protein [Blautia]|uniref:DUF4097 family beta strand repeat-containing protein n=1 Tax=Blautia TaxID=572511 RepID=UPI000BA3D0E3|nr:MULTISPECIES: DUF4097 family beta strand repeat-containing protein [Blautia]